MASLAATHIPGCARVGIARLNAFRLNVYEPIVTFTVDGNVPATGPGTGLLIEGASVQQVLNEQTDTAQFRTRGWTPYAGSRIAVYTGEQSLPYQMFGGRIVETTERYLEKPDAAHIVHDINCIDPTWLLGRTKVLAAYATQSATGIVLDLVARFTRGVTVAHVQAGLPTIDAITFTNESVPQCLTTICQQIGAYWFLDYVGDLHVFTTADQAANAITQANPGPSRDHTRTEDLSQVATRIIGLGGGVGASVDLSAGATELPIDLGDTNQVPWYPVEGGLVQIGAQRLTYTTLKGNLGRGALIGTGNAPTTAPVPAPAAGTGLTPGTYQWAVTFQTAAGETLVGPVGTMQAGLTAPTLNTVAIRAGGTTFPPGYLPVNASINYRVAVLYSGGGFSLGPPTGEYNTGDKYPQIGIGPVATDPVTGEPYNSWLMSSAPAHIVQTQIYRTQEGGSTFYHFVSFGNPINTSGWLQLQGGIYDMDITSGPTYPSGPIATFNAVNLQIPKSSSSSVTGRGIYRTPVNSAALKKLADVANNTATTYFDNFADSALGANAPVLDTSQLREDGQVLVGATELLVTDPAPFLEDGGATGGWVNIGNMTVRYTGITGNDLTGIPPTGPGSLTATVRYGSQVLVQPRLVGIPASGTGAIVHAIRKGDLVTLRMELEDQDAALALAHRFGLTDYHEGLIELMVNDARFGPTELLATLRATLTERKDPKITITYATRDPTHEVGRLVTIDLTTPAITGTFRIQRVNFTEIAIAGSAHALQPKRLIEATNKLYTFADILRQLRGREGGVP